MTDFTMDMMQAFSRFRQDLRQVLADNNVPSNPGWTEDDIVRAFKQLLEITSIKKL